MIQEGGIKQILQAVPCFDLSVPTSEGDTMYLCGWVIPFICLIYAMFKRWYMVA